MNTLARVNVIGTSGSGKSTFGKKLADKLGAKFVTMDQVFWEANWTEPPDERFFPRLECALAAQTWVLDGNYDRARHIKWRNVTAIIWLDFGFFRTLRQVTLRTVRRALTREELWPNTGNREYLSKAFFSRRGSIIWWMITTHKKNRERYSALEQNPPPGVRFVRLKSPAEVERFLEEVK